MSIDVVHKTRMCYEQRRDIFNNGVVQLALMNIPEGGDIPNEVHVDNTQITTIVEGNALVKLDGGKTTFLLNEGQCVIIDKGRYHQIINIGDVPLKLYSFYIPPEED